MARKRISTSKAAKIFELYAFSDLNKTQIAKALKISRGTVRTYTGYYDASDLSYADLILHSDNSVVEIALPKLNSENLKGEKSSRLINCFPAFHERLKGSDANLIKLWKEYNQTEPSGYKYAHFCSKYHQWCKANNVDRFIQNKYRIDEIRPDDLKLLNKWRLSTDRNKWEKAVVILGLYNGENISKLSKQIERSVKTTRRWANTFIDEGLENIDLRRTRKTPKEVKERIDKKSEQLMKLLHESPSLHGINRTSWSLESLSEAYEEEFGESMSRSTVSEYIRAKGYSFKKARTVLTSPDPDYRKKLNHIKQILSGLKENEKFFSIDEYGPVAIKIRGGRTYTLKDQLPTVPQFQISKGSLICTAALELSTNQITHFYSDKKNTAEMIRLLLVLLEQYRSENRIYFSWDAASWHASKALEKKVSEVNSIEYRNKNNTPYVELAPLPSSAQFLNIIESVFSGMAKAIIHNSNYQSVDECKGAIDRYFAERNQAFIENPKRAGKKIWGSEEVKPVFTDSNTCKNPNYR